MLKIAVVLEPCDEGGFSARVPTLPGCFGEGETPEEALDNIRQAIELHLEAADDDLVVEDGSKVAELTWEFTQAETAGAAIPRGGDSKRGPRRRGPALGSPPQ